MPALEVRQQPVPDDRREPRLRAAPVRVPHRPAGLQPRAARDDPVPPQQRRLRVRPGADRPGRGGRDGRPDRRDRRADALLRGGELGRLQAQRRVRAVDAAGRPALPPPPAAGPPVAEADGPAAGSAERVRDEPGRDASAPLVGIVISVDRARAFVLAGSTSRTRRRPAHGGPGLARRSCSRLRGRRRHPPGASAGSASSRRSTPVPLPRDRWATCSSATSPTTCCRPASASSSGPLPRRPRGRQPDDDARDGRRRAGRRHGRRRGDRAFAIVVLSVRGPRRERGARRPGRDGPAGRRAGGRLVAAHRLPGAERVVGAGAARWPRVWRARRASCAAGWRSPAGRGRSVEAILLSASPGARRSSRSPPPARRSASS